MSRADLALVSTTRAALTSGKAREQRELAQITMAEVSRFLGVSRTAVAAWETKASVPTAEHALAYGRLLASLPRTG